MNPVRFCLIIVTVLCVTVPAQSRAMDLFLQPHKAEASSQRIRSHDVPQSMGKTEVTINTDIFALEAGAELSLTLPDDETRLVVFDRLIEHESGNITWVWDSDFNGGQRQMVHDQRPRNSGILYKYCDISQ